MTRKLFDNVAVLRLDSLLGQGLRYAMTGTVVSTVYIAITTVFAVTSKLPFQVGLGIGWSAAIAVHFTLQRRFVWTHDEGFALPFRHQVSRYLILAAGQFAVTATSTALLPPVVGLSAEVVYLVSAVILTLANFLVFRYRVFHPGPTETVPTYAPAVTVLPEAKPA